MSADYIDLSHYPGDFNDLLRNKLQLPPSDSPKSDGLVLLIRGISGTGKTTLALQLTFYLACKLYQDSPQKERGRYYSLEQNVYSLQRKMAEMLFHQISHLEKMKEDLREYLRIWPEDMKQNALLKIIDTEFGKQFPAQDGDKKTPLIDYVREKLDYLLKRFKAYQISLPLYDFIHTYNVIFGGSKYPIDDMYLRDISQQINQKLHGVCTVESILKSLQEQTFPLTFYQAENTADNDIPLFTKSIERGLQIYADLYREDVQHSVITIDGLASLPSNERHLLGIDRIFDVLRKKARVGIVVYEPDEDRRDDHLDYLADMVINLREHMLSGSIPYLINEMHISKARYQDPARGWHQYKMRNWGLEFFPSLHFQVHQPAHMPATYSRSFGPIDEISGPLPKSDSKTDTGPDANTENGSSDNVNASIRGADEKPKPEAQATEKNENQKLSIIEGLTGKMDDGCITVLLGSRGTFKTQLSMDFLVSGEPPEHGLLISLIDNDENLMKGGLKCPRNQCKYSANCKRCTNYIHLFHQRPGCITPAEFLYYIKKRLLANNTSEEKISRLAFWDLTQIDYRFPMFVEDSMFIPGLLDTFKYDTGANFVDKVPKERVPPRNLRSLIMGSANAKFSKAVSAIADNSLYCWRDHPLKETREPFRMYDSDNVIKQVVEDPSAIINDWLMIYVDRRAKAPEISRKNLFAFPIRRGRLKLPNWNWEPDTFAVTHDLDNLQHARDCIRKIHAQQGLE